MSAIAVSADGNFIVVALEDTVSGNQLIARAARSGLSDWTAAYDPGGGSAANVAAVPANPDKMIFYGNFGTDIGVILHTISTGVNSDISPASLGAKVVNTLQVNPSPNVAELIATVDTDQDLVHTADAGTTWETLNAALGFNATALWVLWSGVYYPHRLFVAGDNGANLDLLYSPNEGFSSQDFAGAGLGAAANIVGVEI